MAPMIRTYPTSDSARQAAEELRVAGVEARHIRLLTSEPLRDTSRAARAGFAGPVQPDAPVGAFAGPPRRLGQARGSFAAGGVSGEREPQRRGSFADVDRVTIITHQGDSERSRVMGYRGVRLLFARAALDESTVNQAVKELHNGQSVVLVDAAGPASDEARGRLQRSGEAA